VVAPLRTCCVGSDVSANRATKSSANDGTPETTGAAGYFLRYTLGDSTWSSRSW
jgi:hypothetical protein